MRKSSKVFFDNSHGTRLCGIIDSPRDEIRATALFSHCFTCSKDLKAIVRISRRLALKGIAVLRFDFTGIGDSHGSLADSNFDTNCEDLLAAARYLSEAIQPPSLLTGHSLGGAAMIEMASRIPSVEALVTIATPSSTEHLAGYLNRANPEIVSHGEADVEIGGRTFLLKKQLIDNLHSKDIPASLQQLSIPHLIFHPLEDETLPYWHALRMFELTGGPKSLITLDHSDHLLMSRDSECAFIADTISLWFNRATGYLD